jgi:hypothetical protein
MIEADLQSGGVTVFEFLDLLVDGLFGALHRPIDLVPCLIRLFSSGALVRLLELFGSVFCIPQGFLRRALDLFDDALIGQFLIADCFAHSLLDLANRFVIYS